MGQSIFVPTPHMEGPHVLKKIHGITYGLPPLYRDSSEFMTGVEAEDLTPMVTVLLKGKHSKHFEKKEVTYIKSPITKWFPLRS